MVDEMLKLRELLTKYGIEWQDASTPPDYPFRIDRTHFNYKGVDWSVINVREYDVFDNVNKPVSTCCISPVVREYDVFDNENKGLLELASAAVNKGEPIKHLTADNVIKLVLHSEQPLSVCSIAILDQLSALDQKFARELKFIVISNNARKMRHEPMFRRFTESRGRRMKRTQSKQGKLRNKRHKYT